MAAVPSVALVSDDLMFASRLQLAMRRAGGRVARVAGDGVPDVSVVFIDLNTRSEDRIALIASLRQDRPGLEIDAFCGHGEREVRRRALAAGATRVVNNGALESVALHLAGVDVEQA